MPDTTSKSKKSHSGGRRFDPVQLHELLRIFSLQERPAPIRRALDEARVVIHHGSMLMSEEALVAGRGQVIVPLCLEHVLTARALIDLGVARVVRTAHDPRDVARSLAASLEDAPMARQARAFAEGFWRDSPLALDLPDRLLREVGAVV